MVESSMHAMVSAGSLALAITIGWDRLMTRLKQAAARKRFVEMPPISLTGRDVLADVCRYRRRWGIYCSRPALTEQRRQQLEQAFADGYAYMLRLPSRQDARELLHRALAGEVVMFARYDHAQLVYDFLLEQNMRAAGSYLCLASPTDGVVAETKAHIGPQSQGTAR